MSERTKEQTNVRTNERTEGERVVGREDDSLTD